MSFAHVKLSLLLLIALALLAAAVGHTKPDNSLQVLELSSCAASW